jgi:hypothetical protein
MPIVMRDEVMESLQIRSYESIVAELDRPNLYHNIITTDMSSRYSGEGRSPLDFIMDDVRSTKNKDDIMKTIIYFDSVGQLNLYVKRFASYFLRICNTWPIKSFNRTMQIDRIGIKISQGHFSVPAFVVLYVQLRHSGWA